MRLYASGISGRPPPEEPDRGVKVFVPVDVASVGITKKRGCKYRSKNERELNLPDTP